MILSVDNTKKMIADLQAMAISAIDIFQKGTGTSVYQDLKNIVDKAKDLLSDEKGAWPELKNLNEDDAADLGRASFQAITAIVKKIKKQK